MHPEFQVQQEQKTEETLQDRQEDLFALKSRGADVRIVYSPLDCLKIARANPDKKVVFFAVGFETTAPANAMAWKPDPSAQKAKPDQPVQLEKRQK